MTGMTPDAFKAQMRPEAENRIKTRLTLEAIVAAEGIKVTAKDIDKEVEEMATMYNMEVEKVNELLGESGREQVGKDVANKKAVDLIVKEAVEVEKKEEKKDEE